MGDSGGVGGAHRVEWVGGDATASNPVARGIFGGPEWTEGRGKKGRCSRGRGEKKWGEKGGGSRGGTTILYWRMKVGAVDGVVPRGR
jgi:hypothetical protein